MNVLVAVDAQLFMTPDGKVWSKTIYGYDFWKRYLDVFETVKVVSRLGKADYAQVEGYLRSDGDNVSFAPLPMVRGMKGYVKNVISFLKDAKKAVRDEDCAIIRLPSIPATFVEFVYARKHKPYVLEVVVDPLNAYAGNKLAAKVLTEQLRKSCLNANGVSYVTQYALQEQYPSRARISGKNTEEYFESYYSSIILKDGFFAPARDYSKIGNKVKLVHTANNINNDVKGHDVVIEVVKKLNDLGIDASVTFIGDGDLRPELEKMAEVLGVGTKVVFTGLLGSAMDVREKLLDADIFILPTKAEGLPRAVIEAMAVGLPCLSTPVNGIPELLEKEYMFDPMDSQGFTEKIIELLQNPEKMGQTSMRNINKAREYEETVLQQRRIEFYTKLKNLAKRSQH
jgi:glycosyltransferase involved in cell wall biosynthesis